MGNEGRVALVTGGAGSIGASICRELAAAGNHVAVTDLDLEGAEKLASAINGFGLRMDHCDPESVADAVAEIADWHGKVDIVVNCAGSDEHMRFDETDEAFQARQIDVNLGGAMRVTRAVLPGMIAANWGRVINIVSDAGRHGMARGAIYSGAKGGVIAWTKAIAREYAKVGITANSVSPGAIDTPLFRRVASMDADGNLEARIAEITKLIPMGRLGAPEDVAAATAFFATDGASFITGQTISVGGGSNMT